MPTGRTEKSAHAPGCADAKSPPASPLTWLLQSACAPSPAARIQSEAHQTRLRGWPQSALAPCQPASWAPPPWDAPAATLVAASGLQQTPPAATGRSGSMARADSNTAPAHFATPAPLTLQRHPLQAEIRPFPLLQSRVPHPFRSLSREGWETTKPTSPSLPQLPAVAMPQASGSAQGARPQLRFPTVPPERRPPALAPGCPGADPRPAAVRLQRPAELPL